MSAIWMARCEPAPILEMSRSKPSSSSMTLIVAVLRNVSSVGIGMSNSTLTLGNSGLSALFTSLSKALISSARSSLPGESSSLNRSMTSFSSPP